MDLDTILRVMLGIGLTGVVIIAIVILHPVILTLIFGSIFGLFGMSIGSLVAYLIAPGNEDALNILGVFGSLVCIVLYYATSGIDYIKSSYRI